MCVPVHIFACRFCRHACVGVEQIHVIGVIDKLPQAERWSPRLMDLGGSEVSRSTHSLTLSAQPSLRVAWLPYTLKLTPKASLLMEHGILWKGLPTSLAVTAPFSPLNLCTRVCPVYVHVMANTRSKGFTRVPKSDLQLKLCSLCQATMSQLLLCG